MNLLKEKISKIYFKYLIAAFGSAMISCIYGVVDMAVVGKYEGPNGTAALAIVAPLWNIIYSLGLLMGIGGSTILSNIRGKNEKTNEDNQYFTTSLIGSIILSLLSWLLFIFFEKQLLIFFGGNDEVLLNLAITYLKPILFVFPLYLFNQMLAAFLRNDNDPLLATLGVLAGGIFNIFGDIFFTFTLNMGIKGAGLATAIGSVISFLIMMSHFFKKKNTLRLIKVNNFFKKIKNVSITGFSTFFVDVAMGIITILFNRQIMIYLSNDALSIYGIIINISTFVQCCAYSVGQASQPIISTNYGANKVNRINETLKYSIITVMFFGVIWTLISLIWPNMYIYIFMSPSKEILNIAPSIIRVYALSFLILPFNIFSTYYFQSIMKPQIAFIVSVFRGIIISGTLIILLPLINKNALWFAMPLTELLIMIFALIMIIINTKQLNNKQKMALEMKNV